MRGAPLTRIGALRILIGAFALVYVVARLPELWSVSHFTQGFAPIGVVSRTLSEPLSPVAVMTIAIVTIVALGAMIAGVRAAGPLAAVGLLWTLTYRSSWGQIFHTENLLVLHVIVLACAAYIDDERWAVKLMVALTAATYVLAGIAKLRLAGGAWLGGEQLQTQIAVDNLRKALLGDGVAPLAGFLLAHPALLTVFSITTLVVELGAPIALLGGRPAQIWALCAWGFHLGVVLAMNILFPYPLLGFAFAPLFPVERIRLLQKLRL